VANSDDGTVSRIDPSTYEVTTITVGNRPSGVAVGEGAVWVTVQEAVSAHADFVRGEVLAASLSFAAVADGFAGEVGDAETVTVAVNRAG